MDEAAIVVIEIISSTCGALEEGKPSWRDSDGKAVVGHAQGRLQRRPS